MASPVPPPADHRPQGRPGAPPLRVYRLAVLLACTALVAPGMALAQALPQGGQFVAGQGSIGAAVGSSLTITQTSARGIIDWRSFNIGQGASVTVNNGAGATLNRVTGGDLSQILGSLRATGSLYLVNPQGVVIGSSGVVVTGGRFVASSLDIANDAFMAGGTLVFRGTTENAEVRNLGAISSTGGDVILISRAVRNEGSITTPRGTAALAAGTEVLLREGPEGHRGLVRVSGASGDVTNTGRIEAAQAELRAAGGNIYALAGNTEGLIRATGTETRQGRVWLSARGAGGNVVTEGRIEARNADGTGGKVAVRAGNAVSNTGTLSADGSSGGAVRVRAARVAQQGTISARGTTGAGGTVHLLGGHIALTGAEIDVSGATGGGVVRIGGGFQGGEGLPQASTVTADAATTIRADATQRGTGGDVVLWSETRTDFAGRISARGGAAGGDGGQAEVSSRGVLAYTGTTDLRAPLGAWGTLLLDPYNITISNGTQTTGGPPDFTPNANDSVINATTLLNALATANVTVSTGLTGSPGSQTGNITVTAPLEWSTSTVLTLQANSAINLNAVITAPAGGLTLDAGGTIGATGAITVGRFTLTNGQWAQNTATLPAFTAGDFQIGGGTRGGGTSFLRAIGGAGTSGTPWLLTDIYGVQGIAMLLTSHFRLANDIDAAGAANWNAGAGFRPIGASTTPFTGSLDGVGNVINGLTINRPTQNDVGLFGISGSGSTITRIGLAGGSVRGRDDVGGLVGQNNGTITQAFATGTVSGESNAGGLVGRNSGTITQAYTTGAVSGGSTVGGLVGRSTGTITQAYATGAVPSGGGGLVGDNSGTITASVWDTQTTGRSLGAGAGSTTGTTGLSPTQARGQGGYAGWNFTADWFQAGDMRPIGRWEAAQPGTDGVRVIRNLNQLQLMAINLGDSYRLGNDINAGPTNAAANSPGIWGAGGFVPVGTSAARFIGSLDGDGHVINGLTIDRPTSSSVGLFGFAGRSGVVVTIQNLGLVGGSVVGRTSVGPLAGTFEFGTIKRAFATSQVSGSSTSIGYTGGLVGASSDAILEDVYATGAVTGHSAGGLVGLQVRGTIRGAYATGAVTGSGFGVGGLVGGARLGNSRSGASGTIEQAYALGAVTATDTTGTVTSAGGLIGIIEPDDNPTVESFTNPGRIAQVYATGRVATASSPHPNFHRGAGGLVGEIQNSYSVVFSSSFWDRETTGRAAAIGSSIIPGIDEPKNFSIPGATTALTTAQARGQASYTGWDFSSANAVWFQAQDMRPILRRELAGPVHGVATIRNVNQLQLMATNLGGSYRLRSDINAAATNAVATSPGIWGAGGFVPVGTDAARFTGSLDGAGRVVSGLTINRPTQDLVGLFGVTGTGGTIRDIGLVGGSVSGRDGVGGLVGQNSGTIMWAYATSPVTGRGSVGGLAGINSHLITQTYAAATVTGTGDRVGGLVGQNAGQITDAYASGAVNGTTDVGGLVGANPASGTLTRTYATGTVTGTTNVGGLVGANSGGISASLWNTDINVARPGVGSGTTTGATGRTTAEMQNLDTFRTIYAGWDFANVWAPPNQAGQGNLNPPNAGSAFYPELYNVSSVSAAFARDVDRTYGDANPALVADHRGLRRGDTISTPATIITTATEGSDVGTYAVTASGTAASSPQGRTYRIVHVPGTLTITPRAVTLSGSRVYDGTTAMASSVLRVTNLVGGDALTLDGAGSVPSPNVAAGLQTLTLTGLALGGASAGNYTLDGGSGTATITPRPLTVTADAQSRIYGDANPALTYQLGSPGLVNDDRLTGALATTATPSSPVGGYTISQGDLGNPNYAISFTGNTLTITPRAVTLSGSRVYDGTTAMASSVLRVTNLVGGDALTLAGAGSVPSPNVAAGLQTLALTRLALGGASAGNYTLDGGSGTATITPATLIVTAEDALRLQGRPNPVFTFRTTGLVAGDTPGVISGLKLVSPATAGSQPGAYPITPVGGSAANYTLVRVNGTLTVVPPVDQPRFPDPGGGGTPVPGEPSRLVLLQAVGNACVPEVELQIVGFASGFPSCDRVDFF